jgi:poly-gamma-glutamate synthesis protein (capsule biosynthesis protein)
VGIADTIGRLDQLGIAHTGAGADLEQARVPAMIEVRGRRIAVLSYNCVGPEAAWASPQRAGCNYLRVLTADGSGVTPNAPLERVVPQALEALRADIAAARRAAQLVIVALHKGIVHTPARLAPYERPLAEAAIDAGADVVVGHHAHILRGIELYRGRPIFHGIGNGCVVRMRSALTRIIRSAPNGRDGGAGCSASADPHGLAPFHPEAVVVLGCFRWRADGSLETGASCVVEPPGRPVCVEDERADAVIEYLAHIGKAAGLPSRHWTRVGAQWVCT